MDIDTAKIYTGMAYRTVLEELMAIDQGTANIKERILLYVEKIKELDKELAVKEEDAKLDPEPTGE